MSDKALTFSDDFPAADPAEWRRLAEAALKGRALDAALTSQSDEGLAIRALCTAADGVESVAGVGRGNQQGKWDIRQAALHPDPAEANAEILADLAGGATSLALVLNSGSAGGAMAAQGVVLPQMAS
ncbi:MAG: methylmalonyl-CoA mutase, partial [Proteobacteria bacterium]|nr:methylmalonyl-CoA mutase [Pseudomonadota bacterium]